MYNAADGLLVGLKPRKNFLRLKTDAGEIAKSHNRVGDAISGNAVEFPHQLSNIGSGEHAPGYGLSMQQKAITSLRLESMADSMTEVEDAALSGFALIRRDDARFEAN